MYSFISKCSLNEDIFIKTIESLLCARHSCQDLGVHCPCGAHSPTHRMTLLSSSGAGLDFSFLYPDNTQQGKRTRSLFFHWSLLQIPQKLFLFLISICANFIKGRCPRISLAFVSSDEGQDHSKG